MKDDKHQLSGVEYYFIEEDATRFKVFLPYSPYFYILCRRNTFEEVSTFLSKKYMSILTKIETVYKEDLDLVSYI